MKKIHIILLVLIAGSIAVLISFLGTTSTYETVHTIQEKPGKSVSLMARLDTTKPVEYDAKKNANYLAFHVVGIDDSTRYSIPVVYHDSKPENLEISERLVLQGKYENGVFDCKSIQMKCPSKYKDDPRAQKMSMEQTVSNGTNTGTNP